MFESIQAETALCFTLTTSHSSWIMPDTLNYFKMSFQILFEKYKNIITAGLKLFPVNVLTAGTALF